MERMIFATGNQGKMKEIQLILGDLEIPVVSMKEAGISAEIDENGKSFEENAVIKARTIMELTGEMVLADDSGLEIDFLDGAPGIHSARYMGEDTSYEIKNQAILELMKDVPDEKRTARFVCVIACAMPDGTILTSRGTMEGMIGHEARGENGFGYDPIFYLPECLCTSAELSPDHKNELSHRGKALRLMRELLKDRME
jgi:XTP/dITP diphosphohydrolase